MKKQGILQHLVWLSLLLAANAFAQSRGGGHVVSGRVALGVSAGHYAYAGGFHGAFYWGGCGFGFSFGWPYYVYPVYHYAYNPYPYYCPYPYYLYYGYRYWWVPSSPNVGDARPQVPPARDVPLQAPGSTTSSSPPYANADGQWHKFRGSDDTPTPQGNTVVASVRANNLPALSSRLEGEWHRFDETK